MPPDAATGGKRRSRHGEEPALRAKKSRKRLVKTDSETHNFDFIFKVVKRVIDEHADAVVVLAPDEEHVKQQIVDTLRLEFGDARASALLREMAATPAAAAGAELPAC